MNMILKKQLVHRRGRAGFTLVEVIVVLVILAILAAIAIPALTGYIDKAEDKKYITLARDYNIALRAVLDEAYADGELGARDAYIKSGNTVSNVLNKMKRWPVEYIFEASPTPPYVNSFVPAAALLGQTHPSWDNPGYWAMDFLGDKKDDVTALNTDAFLAKIFPDGKVVGKDAVYVTYKVSHIDADNYTNWRTKLDDATYEPSAGYEIYHFTCVSGML
ncbi:MAG: prepilin-type N-terminal cleavage/methylation domain-containing protein [Clostridiales Family XIII bacterium]|jgi:prepilin-type N-terminal cleavage/methylation domain-containing protein|nr:prepilin-type N-terminal cleavage/methylation domain-containing protein [Clostridiales Family XIII bacterium]